MSWIDDLKLKSAPYWIYSQLVTVVVLGLAVVIWGLASGSGELVVGGVAWIVVFGGVSLARLRRR